MTNNFIIYIITACLVINLSISIITNNMIKKLISLGIFQSCIITIFLLIGYKKDSIVPVYNDVNAIILEHNYTSPLPQVLMLTAIVVGLATFAIGLSLSIKIKENFNTTNMSHLTNDQ